MCCAHAVPCFITTNLSDHRMCWYQLKFTRLMRSRLTAAIGANVCVSASFVTPPMSSKLEQLSVLILQLGNTHVTIRINNDCPAASDMLTCIVLLDLQTSNCQRSCFVPEPFVRCWNIIYTRYGMRKLRSRLNVTLLYCSDSFSNWARFRAGWSLVCLLVTGERFWTSSLTSDWWATCDWFTDLWPVWN